MAITWQDEFATGIEVVDSQHKKIFARFDAFSEAYNRGVTKDELLDLLRFLRIYTSQHFRDEEDYMAGSLYPDLAAQKKAHCGFIDDLNRLEDEVRMDTTDSKNVVATKRLLILWFIQHIRHMDKAFAQFLKA